MAGARTQGVGKGVRWGAFANIAALLSDAGAAQGRGSAALGAGIGGGIGQAFANKRSLDLEARARGEREANRAEDLSEREAVRKEAEFARTEERIYRANRDSIEDSRYTEKLKYQVGRDAASDANVKADNERAKATADATLQQGAAAVARLAAEQGMSALSRAGEVLERKMKARDAAMLPPDPSDLQEMERIQQALMGQAGAKEQAAKFLMQFSHAMPPRAQVPGAAPQAQAPATALPASGPGSVRPGPKGAVLGSEGGKRWMDRLVEAGRDPKVEALTAYEKDLKDYRDSAAKAEADARAALANPKGWSDREKKAAAYRDAQREATLADTTAAKFIGIAGKARAEAEKVAANKKKAEAADAAVESVRTSPAFPSLPKDLQDAALANARVRGEGKTPVDEAQQVMGQRQKAIEDAKAEDAKWDTAVLKGAEEVDATIGGVRAGTVKPGAVRLDERGPAVTAALILHPKYAGSETAKKAAAIFRDEIHKGDKAAAFKALWAAVPEGDDARLAEQYAALTAALEGK